MVSEIDMDSNVRGRNLKYMNLLFAGRDEFLLRITNLPPNYVDNTSSAGRRCQIPQKAAWEELEETRNPLEREKNGSPGKKLSKTGLMSF